MRSLEIIEKLRGKGSIETTPMLNNIANVYTSQGDYTKALEFLGQCLKIQQNIKGKDSIETAISLNNIGAMYMEQGNLLKAQQSYMRSL